MLDIFIQGDLFRQFIQIAIYPHSYISASLCPLQQLCMCALAASHHWGKKLNLCPLGLSHHLIHHLVYRLFHNLPATLWTVGYAHSGIQQAEIIINFRNCPYGWTGVMVGGLLVYRDSRRQPFNALHIGFLHLPQELPRIGGQWLHISALSFCVNRIKGQWRLARSTQSGQHNQFIPWNVQINIF